MIRKWGWADPEPNVAWIGRPGDSPRGSYHRVPCSRGRGHHRGWPFYGETRRSALRSIRRGNWDPPRRSSVKFIASVSSIPARRCNAGKERVALCHPGDGAMGRAWMHPHWDDRDKIRGWPQVLIRAGEPVWDLLAVRERNRKYRAKTRKSKWR